MPNHASCVKRHILVGSVVYMHRKAATRASGRRSRCAARNTRINRKTASTDARCDQSVSQCAPCWKLPPSIQTLQPSTNTLFSLAISSADAANRGVTLRVARCAKIALPNFRCQIEFQTCRANVVCPIRHKESLRLSRGHLGRFRRCHADTNPGRP